MSLSRRRFMGLSAGLGLAGCLRIVAGGSVFGVEGPVTVAAINDLHILDEDSVAIVNRAVKQINALDNVDFTVVIGDLGSDGTESEMTLSKAALDQLKKPYFCVPGNHDYDASTTNGYVNYDASFVDRQWQQEEQSSWAFIGLDTCNGTASTVTIPPERLVWLKGQIAGIDPKRPIALFAHHPFNPNTKAYRVANADDVLELFSDHTLKLVASGHFHGNQIEEQNGTLFTTTACCSTTRNNFDGTKEKGFRLFTLDGATIEHEFVEVPV
ncbi:MAG: metallophosphoesterase [Candidatus Hydrogenedentota bacterium]